MTKELSKYDQSCVKHKQTNKQTNRQNKQSQKIFLLGFGRRQYVGKESYYNIINRIISDRHTYTQCCGVLLIDKTFPDRPVSNDQNSYLASRLRGNKREEVKHKSLHLQAIIFIVSL